MKLSPTFAVQLALIVASCAIAEAQTAGEFWPFAYAQYQLARRYRAHSYAGLKNSEETGYRQVDAGIGLAYQWKTISRPHAENINPDKEHWLAFGAEYERLNTLSGGKSENRMTMDATSGTRPASRVLIQDRNRVELRWVNGSYSTRYRNQLSSEYDILVHKIKFTPHASAEAFYNGASDSWNEFRYTGGVQWPYKRLFMIDTYYMRESCSTCSPPHLNVAGLTLNFFFRRR